MSAGKAVNSVQRFSGKQCSCPICGGHSQLPKEQGTRCFGYGSGDGRFVHCTQPEYAGRLKESSVQTFAHKMNGLCGCGIRHGMSSIPPKSKTSTRTNNDRSEQARRLWTRSLPATGTAVEAYLRSRGLNLTIPPTLRFAVLHHRPAGMELPVMVAAVQLWPGIEPVALHRTYLKPDGSRKADLPNSRLCYGPTKGAAIRLAPPGETLLIAEGIESALSGQQELRIPAWAAISASNMPNIILPELPLASTIIIAADGDETGAKAAERAANSWVRQGRRVKIATSPVGLDFNDLLRGDR